MARRRRGIVSGAFYHVCNRATEDRTLFHAPADFDLWVQTLRQAVEKYPIKIYAFCVMPNHWHLLMSSTSGPAFTKAMQWLGATHAIRLRKRAETVGKGAVYQSRYRCHYVRLNQIFWLVARYIEQNPVRAGLVTSPFAWEWSSAGQKNGHAIPIEEWPLVKPANWNDFISHGGNRLEEARIRNALCHGHPLLRLKST